MAKSLEEHHAEVAKAEAHAALKSAGFQAVRDGEPAYPCPSGHVESKAWWQHLGDNAAAHVENARRSAGVAVDEDMEPNVRALRLKALDDERKHLEEVVGRHGYSHKA